jgi:hypothetical protein
MTMAHTKTEVYILTMLATHHAYSTHGARQYAAAYTLQGASETYYEHKQWGIKKQYHRSVTCTLVQQESNAMYTYNANRKFDAIIHAIDANGACIGCGSATMRFDTIYGYVTERQDGAIVAKYAPVIDPYTGAIVAIRQL